MLYRFLHFACYRRLFSLFKSFSYSNGRCPSCYNNFVHMFCAFTCSPRQSEFMTVTQTATNSTTKKTYVTEVEVSFSEKFAMGMFNSCRDVMMPSGNDRALSVMCGTTADKCARAQTYSPRFDSLLLANRERAYRIDSERPERFTGVRSSSGSTSRARATTTTRRCRSTSASRSAHARPSTTARARRPRL